MRKFDYIKSQAKSDDADPVITTTLIIGLFVVAAIWIFSRMLESAERAGADTANCISTSGNLTGGKVDSTTTKCDNKNSKAGQGHYDY